MSPVVALRQVGVSYPKTAVPVLDNFSLELEAGRFTCILGPSGCGKSTLLQLMGGFLKPQRGEVRVEGRPAVVFQKHSLFPWKTALANIELGLAAAGPRKGEARQLALASLERVGLSGKESHYPAELSLGQQQRVGLARAFALRAPLLLMDEPFAALDAQTRLRMQRLLLEIWEKDQPTVAFVTHDIDEAILLGDRVVVLRSGPASICGDFPVGAPRPRKFSDLASPGLAGLRQKIFELL